MTMGGGDAQYMLPGKTTMEVDSEPVTDGCALWEVVQDSIGFDSVVDVSFVG